MDFEAITAELGDVVVDGPGLLVSAAEWLAKNTKLEQNDSIAAGGEATIQTVPAEDLCFMILIPLATQARKAVQAIDPDAKLPDLFVKAVKDTNFAVSKSSSPSTVRVSRQAVDDGLKALTIQLTQLGIVKSTETAHLPSA